MKSKLMNNIFSIQDVLDFKYVDVYTRNTLILNSLLSFYFRPSEGRCVISKRLIEELKINDLYKLLSSKWFVEMSETDYLIYPR